jgi:hypothetical protein
MKRAKKLSPYRIYQDKYVAIAATIEQNKILPALRDSRSTSNVPTQKPNASPANRDTKRRKAPSLKSLIISTRIERTSSRLVGFGGNASPPRLEAAGRIRRPAFSETPALTPENVRDEALVESANGAAIAPTLHIAHKIRAKQSLESRTTPPPPSFPHQQIEQSFIESYYSNDRLEKDKQWNNKKKSGFKEY